MPRPRSLLCAGLLLGATACHAPPDDPRFITDEQGRALILHGINVSNSAKDDPQRMPWVEKPDVARLADDFGFNFARFLLQWDALEPSPGVYDEQYLDRVAERMRWFADAGIYVVLDMHQDVYGKTDSDGRTPMGYNGAPAWAFLTDGLAFERNPVDWFLSYWQPAIMRAFDNFWDHDDHPELQDRYAAALAHVAARFEDDPIVLGYDIMNEPWAGTILNGSMTQNLAAFDAGPYRAFLERCIAAIRSVDADGWIFFEPRAWGPNSGEASLIGALDDPRSGEPRLAYFPHYYSLSVDAFGNYAPAYDESMRNWARNRKLEIDVQRAPLLIGEWGTGTYVTGWRPYLEDVLRMADRMTSGWAYWEYGRGGWSPIDAAGNEAAQADVLVRSYPQRIAGRPLLVDYDPETKILRVVFDDAPGVTGATEIYLPVARRFPNHFDVWTTDPDGTWSTSWDADREILSYTADPARSHHEIVISPAP